MAEAHKFSTLAKAQEAFGEDFPWKADAEGSVWVWDEKHEDYVSVDKGQFIYKVGSRYEVRDSEELPKTVKPALPTDEKAVEKAIAAKVEAAESDKDS